MAHKLLRFIKEKLTWDQPDEGEYEWLKDGEIPADVLSDLNTDKGELSVWIIEEDNSNFERIIAAWASILRKDFSKIDYLTFDPEILEGLKIPINFSDGNTNDHAANQQWHRNLAELTVVKETGLAERLYWNSLRGRILLGDIEKLLVSFVKDGKIEKEGLKKRLNPKVFKNIEHIIE